MSTVTDITTFRINILTQEQYDEAAAGGLINDDELYLTPAPTNVSDLPNDARYIKAYEEHSGDVATFKDTNIGDLTTEIAPSFSGFTEAKVTRAGKNLLDASGLVSTAFYSNLDGTYTLAKTGSALANRGTSVADIFLPANVECVFTFKVASTTFTRDAVPVRIKLLDDTYQQLTSLTLTTNGTKTISFTPTQAAKGIQFYASAGNNDIGATAIFSDLQVEFGSAPTAYEPYNDDTRTISFGTTVYKGTLDVTTGVLTITHDIVDLGTLPTWSRVSVTGYGYRFFTNDIQSYVLKPTDSSVKPDIYCTDYEVKLPSQYNQPVDGITIYTNGAVQIYDTDLKASTTSAFTAAMDGVLLIYPLATPVTTTLTPQQISTVLGENNVWSTTGQVSVKCVGSYNHTMLVELFYPIGSYYDTSDANFDPESAWGGTWSSSTSGGVTTWHRTA